MKKFSTLVLSATILIASTIFGGFYYLAQTNKQQSIERQQEAQMREDIAKQDAKLEKEEKEYGAKRSNECYSIYEKEREEFNNVEGHFYDRVNDECVVRYTTKKYEGVDCEKEYENLSSLKIQCKLGIFTKRF